MAAFPLIDSHLHFSASDRLGEFFEYLRRADIQQAGIVSLPDAELVNFNPEAFEAKLAAPDRLFVFGGFDYTELFHPKLDGARRSLQGQVELLFAQGADGIKMWVGKPSFQRALGIGIDNPLFAPAFDAAARYSLPVVLHVADPPVFWEEEGERFGWTDDEAARGAENRLPAFAELQLQAERVLGRHRGTTFIFPHLMFRTDDLEGFASFMRRNPNALLDLSPGLYFYGDLHQSRERAVEFFAEFKERILFGSDGMWFAPGHPYLPSVSLEHNLAAATRLLGFLSTDGEIENPFAPTRPELPRLRGLALPREILRPVLASNFRTLMGHRPRGLDKLLVEECARDVRALRGRIARGERAS